MLDVMYENKYTYFKYSVYLIVAINVILFFVKEQSQIPTNNFNLFQLMAAYSSTIDTGAWMILLFLFELETNALAQKNKSNLLIKTIKSICYAFILVAFWGYLKKVLFGWQEAYTLSIANLINSAVWILVVLLLELEVSLKKTSTLFIKSLKGILYLVLFLIGIFYGIDGHVLDFFDAFLWIIAFFLIEENIFQWKK